MFKKPKNSLMSRDLRSRIRNYQQLRSEVELRDTDCYSHICKQSQFLKKKADLYEESIYSDISQKLPKYASRVTQMNKKSKDRVV